MGAAKVFPFLRGEEKAWFTAADQGRLIYQQCAKCWRVPTYTRAMCPYCWSSSLEVKTASGNGVVHTFTVQFRAGGPGFDEDVPYTLVLVDLEEGGRVLADLRGAERDVVRVGLPVEAYFDHVDEDTVLPRFRLRQGATQ